MIEIISLLQKSLQVRLTISYDDLNELQEIDSPLLQILEVYQKRILTVYDIEAKELKNVLLYSNNPQHQYDSDIHIKSKKTRARNIKTGKEEIVWDYNIKDSLTAVSIGSFTHINQYANLFVLFDKKGNFVYKEWCQSDIFVDKSKLSIKQIKPNVLIQKENSEHPDHLKTVVKLPLSQIACFDLLNPTSTIHDVVGKTETELNIKYINGDTTELLRIEKEESIEKSRRTRILKKVFNYNGYVLLENDQLVTVDLFCNNSSSMVAAHSSKYYGNRHLIFDETLQLQYIFKNLKDGYAKTGLDRKSFEKAVKSDGFVRDNNDYNGYYIIPRNKVK